MGATERQSVFGQRVREARLRQSLKGVDLANTVGISAGYLHDIEVGRTSPSLPLLMQLVSALNVSADYLLGFTDEPTREMTAVTNSDLLVRVPLLDEELAVCGHIEVALREIARYSRAFSQVRRSQKSEGARGMNTREYYRIVRRGKKSWRREYFICDVGFYSPCRLYMVCYRDRKEHYPLFRVGFKSWDTAQFVLNVFAFLAGLTLADDE